PLGLLDDKGGGELFLIQAQRDMLRLTKQHDTDRTGNDRQIIVGEGRISGIAESDAMQANQLLVKMVKAKDMHILDKEKKDPELEPQKTFFDMTDGKIALTT